MIIQQLLKLCSCECATGASLRPSTITGVYGDEVPPVLIPNTEVKLISADGTWLDTARESMSTPVSKTKAPNISWVLLFYNPMMNIIYRVQPNTPRGVKMSEQRDSSVGTRSGASVLAFSRREKEHIARRRARSAFCGERRRKAQCVTRTRARESMSTPVSKTKSSHNSVGFLFYNPTMSIIYRVRPRC